MAKTPAPQASASGALFAISIACIVAAGVGFWAGVNIERNKCQVPAPDTSVTTQIVHTP